jgi:hypothetical protein
MLITLMTKKYKERHHLPLKIPLFPKIVPKQFKHKKSPKVGFKIVSKLSLNSQISSVVRASGVGL